MILTSSEYADFCERAAKVQDAEIQIISNKNIINALTVKNSSGDTINMIPYYEILIVNDFVVNVECNSVSLDMEIAHKIIAGDFHFCGYIGRLI